MPVPSTEGTTWMLPPLTAKVASLAGVPKPPKPVAERRLELAPGPGRRRACRRPWAVKVSAAPSAVGRHRGLVPAPSELTTVTGAASAGRTVASRTCCAAAVDTCGCADAHRRAGSVAPGCAAAAVMAAAAAVRSRASPSAAGHRRSAWCPGRRRSPRPRAGRPGWRGRPRRRRGRPGRRVSTGVTWWVPTRPVTRRPRRQRAARGRRRPWRARRGAARRRRPSAWCAAPGGHRVRGGEPGGELALQLLLGRGGGQARRCPRRRRRCAGGRPRR